MDVLGRAVSTLKFVEKGKYYPYNLLFLLDSFFCQYHIDAKLRDIMLTASAIAAGEATSQVLLDQL